LKGVNLGLGVVIDTDEYNVERARKCLDLEPVTTRIILKRKKIAKVGTIIVPGNTRELELHEGEILAVGPDCEHSKVGEVVAFGKYAAVNLERNGEMYILLNEDDITAKIITRG